MPIRFTPHAADQVAKRGLQRSWVETTLAFPDWEDADPKQANRSRAYRAVQDRDGRILRVEYEMDGADIVVISAFLDRGAKRKRPQGSPA